jgi:hypothetical protein
MILTVGEADVQVFGTPMSKHGTRWSSTVAESGIEMTQIGLELNGRFLGLAVAMR